MKKTREVCLNRTIKIGGLVGLQSHVRINCWFCNRAICSHCNKGGAICKECFNTVSSNIQSEFNQLMKFRKIIITIVGGVFVLGLLLIGLDYMGLNLEDIALLVGIIWIFLMIIGEVIIYLLSDSINTYWMVKKA